MQGVEERKVLRWGKLEKGESRVEHEGTERADVSSERERTALDALDRRPSVRHRKPVLERGSYQRCPSDQLGGSV